ncbi:MAG: glycosyltransferase family 4 protein [Opitutus sp.]
MTPSNPPVRPPRILHCVSHLALGGAERVALAIIRELQRDFEFSVFAVRGVADGDVGVALKKQLGAQSIPVHLGPRIPMRRGGIVSGALSLARALERFKPDLLHLHTEIPEASCAALLAIDPRYRSIPVVRTIHNSVIWQFAPQLGRACDRLLAHSNIAGVSQDAVTAFNVLRSGSGAPGPSLAVETIFNGVDLIEARPPYPPSSDMIRIVYGGRLEPEKGTDLLPEILALTQLPTGRRAHLTIFGSGSHEARLRSLAKQPPAGWTVDVLGPVPDFAERLAEFDVALLPSRYEGLALVAIEALRAGIQVVASDASGLREALPPHHPWVARTGDAASFAAALQFALLNRSRWPAIAEAGRSFSLGFSPKAMALGYRTFYQRVLAKTAGERARTSVI